MDKRINLAALPEREALTRARASGRAIFSDEAAVSAVYHGLLRHWTDKNIPNAAGQSDDEFDNLLSKVEGEFEAGVDEAIKAARAESLSTPNLYEGEMATGDALLIVRALQWLHNSVHVDTAREDIDSYQTLVELSLGALGKELETAQRALSACRAERETS
jgi:hypothetical protein